MVIVVERKIAAQSFPNACQQLSKHLSRGMFVAREVDKKRKKEDGMSCREKKE